MAWRKRKKKAKKPAMLVRLAWRLGWKPGRVMRETLEWIEVLAVAGALAAVIMLFITVRMHVPTGSMIPTIDPKDSFFVDRVTYYFRDPTPGDVIVFRHTEEVLVRSAAEGSPAGEAGIEPGERLLLLNGTPVFSTAFIDRELAAWPEGTRIVLTTDAGRPIDLGAKNAGISSLEDLGISTREKRMRYVKRLIAVGGQTVQIVAGDILIDGLKVDGPRFDRYYYSDDPNYRFGVEPTLVPEGHYYVLGDNSASSFDSRYWGFVDERDFIGEPYLRVWPVSRFGLMNR
jgi:signal peptidase I